jgi:hypothetical protein
MQAAPLARLHPISPCVQCQWQHFVFLPCFSFNARLTHDIAKMFPLTFQQGWCREKTSTFAMAPLLLGMAHVVNTVINWTWKSSECAARNCNSGIGVFSHFADPVWLKIFSGGAPAIVHHAITASLHNSKEEHSLHVNCTPRALYVYWGNYSVEETFWMWEFVEQIKNQNRHGSKNGRRTWYISK